MNQKPMILWLDVDHFEGPYKYYLRLLREAFIRAGKPVSGSEERVHDATGDLKALQHFSDGVAAHLRSGSFEKLPHLEVDGQRLHVLTTDPWRGLFLVSRDGTGVVGLAFSREPHRLDDALRLLLERYKER